ncbi:MAG: hypothetical protein AAGH15_17920 [Myxococcota bacterium]
MRCALFLAFLLACAGPRASVPAPAGAEPTPEGHGGDEVAQDGDEPPTAEWVALGDMDVAAMDPAPVPLLRAWRLGEGRIALENAGGDVARLRAEIGAGEGSCVLASEACIELVPGARIERPCAAEVLRVETCAPPDRLPHVLELRVRAR